MMKERIKIEREYERRNEEIVDKLISRDFSVRDAIKEMNKNLGNTLVKLSEIKH